VDIHQSKVVKNLGFLAMPEMAGPGTAQTSDNHRFRAAVRGMADIKCAWSELPNL
jgi:hypothetical protein